MKSICVFLGSSAGTDPAHMEAAAALGRELAERGMICVYGGSRTGLMNRLAECALAAGGEVVGVTVQVLKDKEEFHRGLTRLHVVPTMHQRKTMMIDLADGFVALPGGIGTWDEFFEVITLRQLGFHAKPCGLLDVNGFYQPLLQMLDKAEKEGLMKRSARKAIVVSSDPAEMLDLLIAAEKRAP
ncbi:MAG: TIGR00730 family Rossman fold protein [Desulfobulbaceae bacterium]|nr:MAG: TIGR00730 family Rossman fold protein [Desulfobulbaceae bacterium]